MLIASRLLLGHIEASGQGIYYQPTDEDRPIIEGIMHVCTTYSGYENEATLDELRRRAGLSPSGWGLRLLCSESAYCSTMSSYICDCCLAITKRKHNEPASSDY